MLVVDMERLAAQVRAELLIRVKRGLAGWPRETHAAVDVNYCSGADGIVFTLYVPVSRPPHAGVYFTAGTVIAYPAGYSYRSDAELPQVLADSLWDCIRATDDFKNSPYHPEGAPAYSDRVVARQRAWLNPPRFHRGRWHDV